MKTKFGIVGCGFLGGIVANPCFGGKDCRNGGLCRV